MNSPLPDTNLLTFFLLLVGKRKRLKVVGRSMLPLLQPEEEILINPNAYRDRLPEIDDIVVIIHPIYEELTIVKRISKIVDNQYFLTGDNPAESKDSRHWGLVDKTTILAKVTNRFV